MSKKSRIINDALGGKSVISNYYSFAQWFFEQLEKDSPNQVTAEYLFQKNKDFQKWINDKDEEWFEKQYDGKSNLNLVNVFLAACSYYKIIKFSKKGISCNLNTNNIKNDFLNGLSSNLSVDQEQKLEELYSQLSSIDHSIPKYTKEEIRNISVAYDALFNYLVNENTLLTNHSPDSLAIPLYLAFENIGIEKIPGSNIGDQFAKLYQKYKNPNVPKNLENYEHFKELMQAIGLKFEQSKNPKRGEFINVKSIQKQKDGFKVPSNIKENKTPKPNVSFNSLSALMKKFTGLFGAKPWQEKERIINSTVFDIEKHRPHTPHIIFPAYLEIASSMLFAKNMGFTEEDIYKSVVLENKPSIQTYKRYDPETDSVSIEEFTLNSSSWMHKILPDGTEIYGKINCKFDEDYNILGIAQQRQSDSHFFVKPPGKTKFSEIIVECCTNPNPDEYVDREIKSNLLHLYASKEEIRNRAKCNLADNPPIDPSLIDHAYIVGSGPGTKTDEIRQLAEDEIAIRSKHNKKISFLYLYAPTFEIKSKELISNIFRGKELPAVETDFKKYQNQLYESDDEFVERITRKHSK